MVGGQGGLAGKHMAKAWLRVAAVVRRVPPRAVLLGAARRLGRHVCRPSRGHGHADLAAGLQHAAPVDGDVSGHVWPDRVVVAAISLLGKQLAWVLAVVHCPRAVGRRTRDTLAGHARTISQRVVGSDAPPIPVSIRGALDEMSVDERLCEAARTCVMPGRSS